MLPRELAARSHTHTHTHSLEQEAVDHASEKLYGKSLPVAIAACSESETVRPCLLCARLSVVMMRIFHEVNSPRTSGIKPNER